MRYLRVGNDESPFNDWELAVDVLPKGLPCEDVWLDACVALMKSMPRCALDKAKELRCKVLDERMRAGFQGETFHIDAKAFVAYFEKQHSESCLGEDLNRNIPF